jgi:dihydrofolate reductase
MRKLVVSEFITLDGVMEDPGGGEEFDRGGWAFRFQRGPEGDKFKFDELMESDAMLLGRVTYEGFAAAWPSITDDVGFAEKMNSMPKHVVSSTLKSLDWSNSSLLEGDPIDAVAELKRQPGGNILLAGSATLAQALHEHGLVDEYRLMVFPIVLGGGKRLFGETSEPAAMSLEESSAVGDGVLTLVYRPLPAGQERSGADRE